MRAGGFHCQFGHSGPPASLSSLVKMRTTSSLLAAVFLMSLVVVGCSQRNVTFYCYDGGQIYVGDPNQKVWSGLGGVQLRFEIPRDIDPNTWSPPKELVVQELAKVDGNERVRSQLPSDYRREDYCTNFITLQEYQRRTNQHK